MDTVLGLLEFVVYIAGILALSAAITLVVIKVTPSARARKSTEPPA